MSLLALIGAVVVFREGAICLLIVFPLFYASVLEGALVGRVLFKTYPTRLRVSILPLKIADKAGGITTFARTPSSRLTIAKGLELSFIRCQFPHSSARSLNRRRHALCLLELSIRQNEDSL